VWIATDPNTRQSYLFDTYKAGQREPSVHADAMRARGTWVPVAIDPASRGRGQRDGEQLFQDYADLGLDLVKAANAREAGLYKVWQLLSTGRLKVFKNCADWFEEFRLYRRDEKGEIVKENDHLMDATRYATMTGMDNAIPKPTDDDDWQEAGVKKMSGNAVTGY
jgi:hypothetical protein